VPFVTLLLLRCYCYSTIRCYHFYHSYVVDYIYVVVTCILHVPLLLTIVVVIYLPCCCIVVVLLLLLRVIDCCCCCYVVIVVVICCC